MQSRTPRDIQSFQSEIDFSTLPNWRIEVLTEAFTRVRDEKFLDDVRTDHRVRRIPWMFGENGCYLRAALVRRKLLEWKYPKIKKLFVFGKMKFKSHPMLGDEITFKDHVVCAARVDSQVYVIDPPLNFDRPLLLEEWVDFLFKCSDESDFKLSLVSEYTLSHNCPIDAANESEEVGMKNGKIRKLDYFVDEFLKKEEDLLIGKGLDAVSLLGEKPVWKITSCSGL